MIASSPQNTNIKTPTLSHQDEPTLPFYGTNSVQRSQMDGEALANALMLLGCLFFRKMTGSRLRPAVRQTNCVGLADVTNPQITAELRQNLSRTLKHCIG